MVMQMCLSVMFIRTLLVLLKLLIIFCAGFLCDVLGFHSGKAENSGLLGCDTVMLGE
jgi:hypothetical protein